MSAGSTTVLGMDLEARVTAVEKGLTAVREVELPALRAEMERKIDDVRTETRGWAAITVQTASKVDAASEIINLIYRDVRKTSEDVADMKVMQEQHGRRLDGIDTRLDGMDRRFDGIDTRLDGMDRRFDGIDTRLDGMDGRLVEHGEILQKILAKLS